jgi:hypothetical protein
MPWKMLSAIGQLAAVLIGIPSIIYLAIQIRNQSKESQRAAANVLIAHWTDFWKSLSDNADLAAIHLRGLQSFDALNPVEKLRFGSASAAFSFLAKAFIYFTWRAHLIRSCGRLLSKPLPISSLILARKPGGPHVGTGTRQNSKIWLTAPSRREQNRRYMSARQKAHMKRRPNQSMKPTAPDRMIAYVFATTPCRFLSLSR